MIQVLIFFILMYSTGHAFSVNQYSTQYRSRPSFLCLVYMYFSHKTTIIIILFLGRGRHSHAYTHSVQMYHHVFLNLSTLEFYCLPDNYRVIDASLEDIKVISVCILFNNVIQEYFGL